jgi:chaperone required for assembly of F1-ATPase
MTEETPDERMRRLLTGQYIRQLPRKFYTDVQLSDANAILLDGRPVKTPMKHALVLPNRKLAEAVADEWRAQDKVIDPELMPITKLANTALDRATAERLHVINEVVEYAGSDHICYWADRPPELVQMQRQHWQPVLDWARVTLSAHFKVASSITHIPQDAESLASVRSYAEKLDEWQLTGLYLLMTLTGSSLLAIMLQSGAANAEAVWTATHVDEDYQISQWGEDAEAIARRKTRRREFDGLVRFFELLRA